MDRFAFNKTTKQELVYHCLVKRYSEKQTQRYIKEKTDRYLSLRTIEKIKKNLIEESRKHFFALAKQNDETYLELELRINSTKILINELWKDFEEAKGNPIARTRLADQILKAENQIYEWTQLLTYEHGNGNIISEKEYSETF